VSRWPYENTGTKGAGLLTFHFENSSPNIVVEIRNRCSVTNPARFEEDFIQVDVVTRCFGVNGFIWRGSFKWQFQ
jgi:hypothetical protein